MDPQMAWAMQALGNVANGGNDPMDIQQLGMFNPEMVTGMFENRARNLNERQKLIDAIAMANNRLQFQGQQNIANRSLDWGKLQANLAATAQQNNLQRQAEMERARLIADTQRAIAMGGNQTQLGVQNLRNAGMENVANIRAGSAMDVTTQQGRDALARQMAHNTGMMDVERLRTEAANELARQNAIEAYRRQELINSGNYDVENLRSTTQRDVVGQQLANALQRQQLINSGLANVEGMRGRTQQDIAQLQALNRMDVQRLINQGGVGIEEMRGNTQRDVAMQRGIDELARQQLLNQGGLATEAMRGRNQLGVSRQAGQDALLRQALINQGQQGLETQRGQNQLQIAQQQGQSQQDLQRIRNTGASDVAKINLSKGKATEDAQAQAQWMSFYKAMGITDPRHQADYADKAMRARKNNEPIPMPGAPPPRRNALASIIRLPYTAGESVGKALFEAIFGQQQPQQPMMPPQY